MTTALDERRLRALTGPAALLVIDVQRSFAEPARLHAWGLDETVVKAVTSAVETTARLVDAARAAGLLVVWVELGSEPGRPWRASAWLRSGDPDAWPGDDEPCLVGTEGAEWWGLSPAPTEPRVVKRGYSGFRGTPLEAVLRAAGIEWLAVAGLTTECCVAATVFDAVQADWPVLLVTDGCAAYEAGLHEAAVRQLELNAAMPVPASALPTLWSSGVVAR